SIPLIRSTLPLYDRRSPYVRILYNTPPLLPKHLKTNIYLQATVGKKTDISRFFKNRVYREVLLGFKPLYRAYTRNNLSSVLLKTLNNYKIQDRVFRALSDNINIIRIPYLTYVI
ncbi:uncharacterized protein N7496_010744, partial [Penicillium cataractarum]